ncbi:hypothetical protein H0H81_010295 [Sphagnurus paluster]|uniref:Pentatricopeptide repeat-containing protein n=1 Tax=Sphagnurus paluster TaxID=117069 RepID=A0A9P7GPC8_9AGAR|nr:hypothetical protein H0H81_010295 [Sphagnurus paluster]
MYLSRGLSRLTGLRNLTRVANHTSIHSIRPNSTVSHDVGILSSTLLQKLQSQNPVSAIHNYYPALVAELQKTATTSSSDPIPSLNYQQLVTLLDVLATSGRPADLQRIDEILRHMPSMFGINLTIDIHTVILRGLIKHGNDQTIHRWLRNMPSRPIPFTPTLEQFHMVLEACLETSPFRFIRHVIRTMRQTGRKPTTDTFKYLIRSRWDAAAQEEKVPHVYVFSSILDDMKMESMRYDASIEELLYKRYADLGFNKWAEQIQKEYRSRFFDDHSAQKQQDIDWNSQLSRTSESNGVRAAIQLFFNKLKPQGCTASPEVLRALVRHSNSLEDLRKVEKELDVRLSVDHWSIVIANNVRVGNLPEAQSIYEQSKLAGVVPDAALVHPLIKALCQSTTKSPSEDSLDSALEIYRDLAKVAEPSSTTKESYAEHSIGPDAGIYHTLLRGIASSPNLTKYFPIAKDLLDDMEKHKISTSDSLTASSIIVLFMRRAETLSDALDVYYGLRSSLDEKGYAIVLNAFCKLNFGDELHVPSLSSYFEIVKDMRRAGLEITIEVYTILLHQLAILATKSRNPAVQAPATLHDILVTTTRRTHDFLTLDAAVSPDEQVWNQLMDTYQRLGCFGDAYRVWDTMYLSGRFNHVSVSIILDACGYAGAWQVAKKICTQLFRDRFSFNLHNWNTWVECLCRLGKLNDALKVVCTEMGKNQNTVLPDVELARILIKFARKDNQEAVVLERLGKYLPELWAVLPEDLRAGAIE